MRLLCLLLDAELTVTELVTILGQSQPRISRHLKLLVEAGLVERHREGGWAFFSAAHRTPVAEIVRETVARLDPADSVLLADRSRLADVRVARHSQAERYFASQAADWDRLRSLHVSEERVETAVSALVGSGPFQAVLDLGTGTGRLLEMLAPRAARAVGVDSSPAMLSVARARLDAHGWRHVQLRQGDLYALPLERDGYDVIVISQVLHYLDDPGRALREAARVLRPGGRLLVVDFAPHSNEDLRSQHAHRRLGFARTEVDALMDVAGLHVEAGQDVVPTGPEAGKLTVSLWIGRDRRILTDIPSYRPERAVA